MLRNALQSESSSFALSNALVTEATLAGLSDREPPETAPRELEELEAELGAARAFDAGRVCGRWSAFGLASPLALEGPASDSFFLLIPRILLNMASPINLSLVSLLFPSYRVWRVGATLLS